MENLTIVKHNNVGVVQLRAGKGRRAALLAFCVGAAFALASNGVAPVAAEAKRVKKSSRAELCKLPQARWPARLRGPVPLCGKTVVHAEGLSAVVFEVPDVKPAPRAPEETIRFRLREGTFAYFGLNPPRCPLEFHVCFSPYGYINRGFDDIANLATKDPPTLMPGRHSLFVLSDGRVDIELVVEGLPGSIELDATGSFRGRLELLPRNCPATDCANVAYGGRAFRIGKGAVGSIAWARSPGHIGNTGVQNLASTKGVMACVYPGGFGFRGGSPEPEDHPTGCDVVPNENDPNTGPNFLLNSADVLANGYMWHVFDPAAEGKVYAGYIAQQASPVIPGGSSGGWGLWIDKRVRCPSGDFRNCRRKR